MQASSLRTICATQAPIINFSRSIITLQSGAEPHGCSMRSSKGSRFGPCPGAVSIAPWEPAARYR